MVGLGFLPGATDSGASAVSADGAVVVGNSGARMFRWTAAGMVNVALMANAQTCNADDVSSNGSVIVGTCNMTPQPQAFIWDQARGMRSIAAALAAAGVNTSGYLLEYAAGVSGDGKVVVGYGRNPNNYYEAWIARLP
jgi:uncharacterized membrane protein